ncbi:hypothetical protein JZ751_015480 [Albula glossodonta]|uniref:Chemokine interleukin-8-like domain-containing protein n=1 Tax=Albula glossodonta TaxID=121402 RepID=A0A8T2MJ83_9TELE|nr:hypothetical protein JZ751_015480 [Albula glossodonta]
MKIFRNVLLCVAVLQMCPPPCQCEGLLALTFTERALGSLLSVWETWVAVRFTTVKGTTICSDPNKRWVKKCKRNIGARKKAHMATAVKSPHLTTESAVTRSTTNKTCQG